MDKHNKNEEHIIVITDIGTNGEGIGHLNDGYTLFVSGALPGDTINARIIKAQKKYGIGRLMSIIEASPDRITPTCSVSNKCGGCQISALSYEAQLKYKENKVRELLTRVGGFDSELISQVFHPIVGYYDSIDNKDELEATKASSQLAPVHFRNKAQYPVGTDANGEPIVGFYSNHSHRIIPCTSCEIGADSDSRILSYILSYMKDYHVSAYDETLHQGLIRHVLIRTGFATNEIMVCLVINGKSIPAKKEFINGLLSTNPNITSICTSSNTADTNVIMGNSYDVIYGNPYITDYIGDVSFRISPLSFYQVNPVQTKKLYSLALNHAGLTGSETVWDLYCGIGTISLFLAQKAGHVYGVEIVPQAIDNAKENAEINKITNVDFFVGKAEEVLPAFYEGEVRVNDENAPAQKASYSSSNAYHPDVIVVDPPRKGCDSDCLNTMLKMAPSRIVYVSCDPATLSRDLKYLCESGEYTLTSVTPVDMFANSIHVETVCLLSKLHKATHYVSVKLDMDEMDLTSAESKATYEKKRSICRGIMIG